MKKLCIDIGGTRIKAAILDNAVSMEALKNTKVEVFRSLGWLNHSLPEIVSKSNPASIFNRRNGLEDYDAVSICMPSRILNGGSEVTGYYVEKHGVPRCLKNAIADQVKCDVSLMNDAVSWLTGALSYCRLCPISMDCPCLFLALGTGVGIGYTDSMQKVLDLEINDYNFFYKHLSQTSGNLIDNGWKVHACLGEKYLQSIRKESRNLTFQAIRAAFTDRVEALLMDMKKKKLVNFSCLKTLLIGGGNAEYIDAEALKTKLSLEVFTLTPANLHINPDLIPLLGQMQPFS